MVKNGQENRLGFMAVRSMQRMGQAKIYEIVRINPENFSELEDNARIFRVSLHAGKLQSYVKLFLNLFSHHRIVPWSGITAN